MTYKVSVVIPTYNVENYISIALNSLKQQTIGFENIEIIIVDNNSTDSTKEILKEYESLYTNVKCFFQNKNTGSPSSGRNIGIENANSEYIMFLDSDDFYIDTMCEVLYDTIQKENTDIVMCKFLALTNDFDISTFKQDSNLELSYLNPKIDIEMYGMFLMWDKIFKLDFLKKYNIKCPEGYFREDLYFCTQAYLNTNKMVLLDNYYGYVWNIRDSKEDSSSSNTITEKFLLNNIRGELFTLEVLRKTNNQEIINYLMNVNLLLFFKWFIIVDCNHSSKINILNDLYNLIDYSSFSNNINEFWGNFILSNIKKRHFNRVILFSSFMKIFYSPIFIKFYRKIYNKGFNNDL